MGHYFLGSFCALTHTGVHTQQNPGFIFLWGQHQSGSVKSRKYCFYGCLARSIQKVCRIAETQNSGL